MERHVWPLTHLHNAVTDGAVLPFPQQHQTDHNHGRYGHCNHQQANQSAASEAEIIHQGAERLLLWSTAELWGKKNTSVIYTPKAQRAKTNPVNRYLKELSMPLKQGTHTVTRVQWRKSCCAIVGTKCELKEFATDREEKEIL